MRGEGLSFMPADHNATAYGHVGFAGSGGDKGPEHTIGPPMKLRARKAHWTGVHTFADVTCHILHLLGLGMTIKAHHTTTAGRHKQLLTFLGGGGALDKLIAVKSLLGYGKAEAPVFSLRAETSVKPKVAHGAIT